MNDSTVLRLRPHHLLCIPHFTGHGYDAAFTANMTAVTDLLRAHPETPVILTPDCDDLCAACPHSKDGVCASQEKVTALDSAVLAACALPAGHPAAWSALTEPVRRCILQTDLFRQICSSCEWYDLCRIIHTEKEYSHD
ncbi:MAG: DUF1284 domain-containing protein [Oscillospiraceae bacterium]|nr:DUF1284 domain-containing protein [Oscillospiraceae bacterium]